MQAAVEATARRLRLAAALFLATLAVFAATAARASAAQVCGVTGPRVCVDLVGNSGSVSPSAVTPTFASYTVIVTNEAKNTVTHVTLTNVVAGGTFVSAAPSVGTCAAGRCVFGQLPSGGRVMATILAKAPSAVGSIVDTATVSFDEGFNDSPAPDPQQDTVTNSATTAVTATPGAADSLVPSNTEVQLDTDPTFQDKTTPADPNIGRAKVPASAHDPITASLDEVPGAAACPKKVICRSGAWLHAVIPGTFSPALEFTLHWNKSLVPKQQSTKNLAVLHTDCIADCSANTLVEVISQRCSSSTPAPAELPCLSDVVETADEFKATLHSKTNGYMR